MPKPNRYAEASAAQYSQEKHWKNKRSINKVYEQAASPLLRLPFELRTAIWALALPHSVRPHLPVGAQKEEALAEEDKFAPEKRLQYIFDNTFPLCRWQRGNLSLLQTCKRINIEATRTFFKSNVFDCLIDNPEPSLVVEYGDAELHAVTSEDLDLQRQDTRSPGMRLSLVKTAVRARRLSTIKREHIALIRGWVLAFPTHLGLDFEQQADDADYLRRTHPSLSILPTSWWGPRELQIANVLTETRDAGTKWERKEHRRRVLLGFDRWSQLVGSYDAERRFSHLELTFYRYFDCAGKLGGVDDMLVEAVKKSIPHWMLVQVDAIH